MRYVNRILVVTVLALSLLYVCDDLSIRYRIPKSRDPFGNVQIKRYYAVPLKDRKTEFYMADPEAQVCVHSLFPHLGYDPCWYLERKKMQRIDM